MAYEITTEKKPGYLYVRIEGTLESGQVQQLAKRVAGVIERDRLPGLLVDVRDLQMNVDVITTMRLVRSFPEIIGNLRMPTAIVYDSGHHDIVKFYETVATNRGYMTRMFSDVAQAAAWLGG